MASILRDIHLFLLSLGKVLEISIYGANDHHNIKTEFSMQVQNNVKPINYTYRNYKPNK